LRKVNTKKNPRRLWGAKMEAQWPNLRMFNFQVLFPQEMAWRNSRTKRPNRKTRSGSNNEGTFNALPRHVACTAPIRHLRSISGAPQVTFAAPSRHLYGALEAHAGHIKHLRGNPRASKNSSFNMEIWEFASHLCLSPVKWPCKNLVSYYSFGCTFRQRRTDL
jgi:hypothetical protein